jgi:hypothetical protein
MVHQYILVNIGFQINVAKSKEAFGESTRRNKETSSMQHILKN